MSDEIGTERVDEDTALEKAVNKHDPINSIKRASFRAGWYAARKYAEAQRRCVCDVGVQECPVHPGRLLTKEEKIQFRKNWDRRVR